MPVAGVIAFGVDVSEPAKVPEATIRCSLLVVVDVEGLYDVGRRGSVTHEAEGRAPKGGRVGHERVAVLGHQQPGGRQLAVAAALGVGVAGVDLGLAAQVDGSDGVGPRRHRHRATATSTRA